MTPGPRGAGELLLVSGHRWLSVSRLALAAREAGFVPHLLAPRRHPAAQLPWVQVAGELSPLQPSRSVARALADRDYALVVPADDVAAAAIFDAHRRGILTLRARTVVERSLGDPATFGIRHSRAAVGELALRAGVTAPLVLPVRDEDALDHAASIVGLPAVLKTDASCGGQAVEIASTLSAAHSAFRRLRTAPRLAEGVGRQVLDRDPSYLAPALWRKTGAISVQEYVRGWPATLSVAAWCGTVLGSHGFRALSTRPDNGPATVVEPIAHPGMEHAARALAQKLGLSGLFGLDFIVSEDDSRAFLIELNPRATPTAHLAPGTGASLLGLLAAQLGHAGTETGGQLPAGPIALYPPSDSESDPDAAAAAYLDVPNDRDIVELWRTVMAARPAPLIGLIRWVF